MRPLLFLRRRSVPLLIAALVVVAALLAFLLWTANRSEEPPSPTVDVNAIIEETLQTLASAPAVSAQVYQAILPSIVVVQTDTGEADGVPGIGSGVVVSDSADVLTALHVLQGAQSIQLGFADGTVTPGFVSNVDAARDITVLRPWEMPNLVVPATVGSSSAMNVGDEVFAVGNPLGLVASLSAGVVSGLNRRFQPSGRDVLLENVIQFDAAVNLGNSGGPLLNNRGQVVGIVTGLLNPSDEDTFIGIGFAIPIDVAVGAAGGPGQ